MPDPSTHPSPASNSEGRNDRLFEQLYRELHAIAALNLKGESPSFSLGATAVVNEAWLRLRRIDAEWKDKRHFIRCAASMIRHCIIDHVRSRKAAKRPPRSQRKHIDSMADTLEARVPDLVALGDALERLKQRDPRLTQVVELRFFLGHSVAEVAQLMDVSERQTLRWWQLARAWLKKELAP